MRAPPPFMPKFARSLWRSINDCRSPRISSCQRDANEIPEDKKYYISPDRSCVSSDASNFSIRSSRQYHRGKAIHQTNLGKIRRLSCGWNDS